MLPALLSWYEKVITTALETEQKDIVTQVSAACNKRAPAAGHFMLAKIYAGAEMFNRAFSEYKQVVENPGFPAKVRNNARLEMATMIFLGDYEVDRSLDSVLNNRTESVESLAQETKHPSNSQESLQQSIKQTEQQRVIQAYHLVDIESKEMSGLRTLKNTFDKILAGDWTEQKDIAWRPDALRLFSSYYKNFPGQPYRQSTLDQYERLANKTESLKDEATQLRSLSP